MTTQTYQQASQRFLAQAKEELAAGDLPQASEKGWGATAQILKAVAEQRGWEHSRHRHHLVTVSRLRAETGDGDIRRLFNTASALPRIHRSETSVSLTPWMMGKGRRTGLARSQ